MDCGFRQQAHCIYTLILPILDPDQFYDSYIHPSRPAPYVHVALGMRKMNPVTLRVTRWLTPWLWAPLIMVLAFNLYPAATIFVGGAYLLIPIAGYLAARHGTNGWAVVAVSGFIAFIPIEGLWAARPELGIYVAALLVGWGLRDKPIAAESAPPLSLNPWVYLGIFLLPVQLGLGAWLSDIAKFNLLALLYLLVFLLGLRRLRVRPIVIALIASATFGMLLEYLALPRHAAEWIGAGKAELPLLGLTSLREWYVHYAFDSPAALLTALGFLCFGRFLGLLIDREVMELPSPMVRVGLLLPIVLLTFGGRINDLLASDHGVAPHFLGHAYAVILLGMLAGFFFRFAGIVTTLFIAIGFWWIDGLIVAKPDDTDLRIFFNLSTLLYLYGFGLLGIGMRDAIQGTVTNLWSWLWFRYLIMYFLVLFAVIDVDSSGDLLLLAFTFVAGIALTMAFGRLRVRLLPREIKVAGGWLSLLTAIMASYLIYSFGTGAWEGAQEMIKGMSGLIGGLILGKAALDDNLAMVCIVVALSFVSLSLVVSTLRKLAESAGQLIDDLKALVQRLRTGEAMVIKIGLPVPQATHDVTPARPASHLQSALTWVNRILFAGAVVVPLVLFGYNGWLEYRQDLADDRKFARLNPGAEEKRAHDRQERERLKRDREQIRIVLVERLTGVAIEALREFPYIVAEHRKTGGTVSTGWLVDAADRNVRRRASVHISISLSRIEQTPPEKLVLQSIRVRVDRQVRGRFGLWVEPGYAERSDPELAKSLQAEIEARAIAVLTAEQVDRSTSRQ